MTEMVERVAKVISTELDRLERRRGYHLTAESFARAVIAAMREPTSAMLRSGARVGDIDDDPRHLEEDAGEVWGKMIEKALEP